MAQIREEEHSADRHPAAMHTSPLDSLGTHPRSCRVRTFGLGYPRIQSADVEDEPLTQGVRALTLSSSDVLPAAPQEHEPASEAVDTTPRPRARLQ